MKDIAIPVAPVQNKVVGKRGGCNQRSSKGSRSRGAKCAFKHDGQGRGKGAKETSDSGRQVRRKESTRQEQRVGLFESVARKVTVLKDKNCDHWHPSVLRLSVSLLKC